jgi:HlyD family secretion protein
MPTRNRSRPEASDKDDKAKPAAHLYILRDGKAESIPIKAGLTDGRYTEVSGEGLSEGMLVILRNNTPAS